MLAGEGDRRVNFYVPWQGGDGRISMCRGRGDRRANLSERVPTGGSLPPSAFPSLHSAQKRLIAFPTDFSAKQKALHKREYGAVVLEF